MAWIRWECCCYFTLAVNLCKHSTEGRATSLSPQNYHQFQFTIIPRKWQNLTTPWVKYDLTSWHALQLSFALYLGWLQQLNVSVVAICKYTCPYLRHLGGMFKQDPRNSLHLLPLQIMGWFHRDLFWYASTITKEIELWKRCREWKIWWLDYETVVKMDLLDGLWMLRCFKYNRVGLFWEGSWQNKFTVETALCLHSAS